MLPERIDAIREKLAPIFDAFTDLDSFINNVAHEFSRGPGIASQTVTVETPNSLLQIIATSAPFAIIQMFFATLVIYFFLAGWTKMRKRTITNRASFDGAMTTARVIQQVVDATSHLSRHHHHREHRRSACSWRSSSGPSGCRIAAHVGRHRRGDRTTSPISGRSSRRCCSRVGGLMVFRRAVAGDAAGGHLRRHST